MNNLKVGVDPMELLKTVKCLGESTSVGVGTKGLLNVQEKV